MLRYHVRTAMFARRATGAVTLSDISYTASGIALVAVALWLDQEGERVTSVLAALAIANLIAIGVALRALRLRIRVSLRAAVWRRYRRIWSDVAWSLFGATTWNIQSQGMTFLVAAIAGPAAYAPIAAGYRVVQSAAPGRQCVSQCVPRGFRRGACGGPLSAAQRDDLFGLRADPALVRDRGRARSGSPGRTSTRTSSAASSITPRCRWS